MLKILGRPGSINVRKVLWTCEELSLPYQLEPWGDASLPLQSPAFLALNPQAMVPVIDDAGFILRESNTICRYLANRHDNGSLLPRPSRERALVEQWMDWQASELNPAWRYAFMALVRASPLHQNGADIDASIAAWQRAMELLERHLQHAGPYVTGAHFSLADVLLGLSINRWQQTPLSHPSLPAVERYMHLLRQRAAGLKYASAATP